MRRLTLHATARCIIHGSNEYRNREIAMSSTPTANHDQSIIFVTRGVAGVPVTEKAVLKSISSIWANVIVKHNGTESLIRLPVPRDTKTSAAMSVTRLVSVNPKLSEADYLSYGDTVEQSEECYARVLYFLKVRRNAEAKAFKNGLKNVNEAKKKIAAILDEHNLRIDGACYNY